MKKILFILLGVLTLGSILAQEVNIATTHTPLVEVPQIVMPEVDNDVLREEELANRRPGRAPRFALVHDVEITPSTHGLWEELANGMSVWRLRILSEDAYSLNLGFTEFFMPRNGALILYSPDSKHKMGPFTPADNEEHEQLWTPVFDGEELVVEVQVPTNEVDDLRLKLTSINHDFLGFTSVLSGSCNLDVICGEEDGWGIVDGYRDIIQSVAVYGTGGSTFCTGFLVNNTAQDCTPLFMTADHCMSAGQAASIVVYWNFFNSTCREPNTPASGGFGNGSLADFNTGGIFRANYAPSDVFLLELDDEVSSTANAFFAGWSAETTLIQDTLIAVHHPNTDEKRISFDFDGPTITEYGGDVEDLTSDHVRVLDWDIGTTEPGSSGSPLFDANKRVIGQLHGGGAACGNDLPDWYGWVHTSWEGGGTPNSSIKTWLDPINSGLLSLDGRSQESCGFVVEVAGTGTTVCAPDEIVFTLTVSENFENDVDLTVTGVPAGAMLSWTTNTASPGGTIDLVLQNTADVGEGNFDLTFEATDGANTFNGTVPFGIVSSLPNLNLVYPIPASTEVNTIVNFSWASVGITDNYELELATDEDFTNIIHSETNITAVESNAVVLMPLTTYYWRVKGMNICGEGEWSTAMFTTANITCSMTATTEVNIPIETSSNSIAISTIEITNTGLITDVSISGLDITHSWIGDLEAVLISPQGTEIVLFDQPGVESGGFGCGEDNMLIDLSDVAANTAEQLEQSCEGGGLAISGAYQPIDAFAAFLNEEGQGVWTLRVMDSVSNDGGAIMGWSLNICQAVPNAVDVYLEQNEWEVCSGDDLSFDLTIGGGFTSAVTVSANNLPDNVEFSASMNPVDPSGGTVVSFNNWNVLSGEYTIELLVTNGTETVTKDIVVTVSNEITETVAITSIADNAYFNTTTPLLIEWDAIANAANYNVVITEGGTTIAETDVMTTSYEFDGAEVGSEYTIAVFATNICGDSPTTTITVYAYDILAFTPQEEVVCNIDTAYFTATVPLGMEQPIVIDVAASDAALQYSTTPATLQAGEDFTLKCFGLFNASSDNIQVEVVVSDANYATAQDVFIEVNQAPAVPTINFPEDGSEFINSNINFLWDLIPAATGYVIEISNDPTFETILETGETITNTYNLESELDPNIYYWRVTAINECGAATTAIANFEIKLLYTVDWIENFFQVYPSPTQGNISIALGRTLDTNVPVEVFDVTGKLMMKEYILKSRNMWDMDLSHLAEGVYIIKLTWQNTHIVKRIVVQQ